MEQPVSSGHTCSCETETQATCRSYEYLFCLIHADCRSLHGGRLSHLWERTFATLALQMPFGVGATIPLTTPARVYGAFAKGDEGDIICVGTSIRTGLSPANALLKAQINSDLFFA